MTKSLFKNCLIVALTLGTTWAVRGQFGHEQGAAWAGAVAALSIIVLAKRADWNAKVFKATLAAAIGWGLGGMMSYGIVVGYGNGVEFINVYYGLTMLFVIGGLYGFIGGGLFGLVLNSSSERTVDWLSLSAKMVAGGFIAYFFLIAQWGWTMTPPRSELWAACLGMGMALIWHLIQEKEWSALRVAVYAGLGAGFGFGFGNFLQVMGRHSEIAFNFWNVMEYSLGFFGGLGMAYGAFTSSWPEQFTRRNWGGHLLAFLVLTLFIPYVIWKESFTQKKLESMAENVGIDPITGIIQILVLAVPILVAIFYGRVLFQKIKLEVYHFSEGEVKGFFNFYFLWYIVLSLILTGAFLSTYRPEQYLYLLNYAVILFLMTRTSPAFLVKEIQPANWGKLLILILAILAIATLIALQFNQPFEGMHRRFEF